MKAFIIGIVFVILLFVGLQYSGEFAESNIRTDHIEIMKYKETYNENTKQWTVTDDKNFYIMDSEKKIVLTSGILEQK